MQVADELLEFWSNFIGAVASTSIQEVQDRFRPYIDRLVVCLCMLCQVDATEVSEFIRLLPHLCSMKIIILPYVV